MSEGCRSILHQLNSAIFLSFLDVHAGIREIWLDPYPNETVFTIAKNAGKLEILADYSHHDRLLLKWRVNVNIYSNKAWRKGLIASSALNEFDVRLVKSYEPLANRVVIF